MTTIYGISNCDSCKKARQWLDQHDITYRFHDFRKDGLDGELLARWCEQLGWEALLNRRGTTWRQLPPASKELDGAAAVISLMLQYPTLIKRPVVTQAQEVRLGFDPKQYEQLLA